MASWEISMWNGAFNGIMIEQNGGFCHDAWLLECISWCRSIGLYMLIYIYSFIFRTHQEFSDQTVACLGGKYVTKGEASVRPLELFMCSVVKRDLMVRSIESCWVDPSPLMVSTGKPTKNGTLKMSWWKISDSANLSADGVSGRITSPILLLLHF